VRAIHAELLSERNVAITVTEGKYHQLKRMISAVRERARACEGATDRQTDRQIEGQKGTKDTERQRDRGRVRGRERQRQGDGQRDRWTSVCICMKLSLLSLLPPPPLPNAGSARSPASSCISSAQVGNRCEGLRRVSIAGLELPTDLDEGEWRYLSGHEREALLA
jgi:hypothetical protein